MSLAARIEPQAASAHASKPQTCFAPYSRGPQETVGSEARISVESHDAAAVVDPQGSVQMRLGWNKALLLLGVERASERWSRFDAEDFCPATDNHRIEVYYGRE
jgi:hypothetical protein